MESTNLAKEKELVEMAIASSYTAESNYTKVGSSELQTELSKNLDDYIFSENADGTFTIKIENREYQVSETGTIIYVEHIIDTTPGVLAGTGTESDPYLIESGEDLVVFSYNVRNGNSYEGKYIELRNNINLASLNSFVDGERTDYGIYGYDGKLKDKIQEIGFIPIGERLIPVDDDGHMSTNYTIFLGNFNGKNYTISNFNIEAYTNGVGWGSFGLFARVNGKIENLNVVGNIICSLNVNKFSYVGMLVGRLDSNGEIKNCSSSGKIIGKTELASFNFGGLCGENRGVIKCCFNNANVIANVENAIDMEIRLGGICGVNESSGRIENSYNTGRIEFTGEGAEGIGTYFLGGIAGRQVNTVSNSLERCYSLGNVECSLTKYRNIYRGLILGHSNQGGVEVKVYSLNPNNYTTFNLYDCNVISSSEMQSDDFVYTLNEGLDIPIWKKDTGINNGYPILIWQ